MYNFHSYIVCNKDGKLLDPSFVMGQLKPITLYEKEEILSNSTSEALKSMDKFFHNTEEDAEISITWYHRACELMDVTPEKLHIEKVQLTVIFKEV